MQWLNGELDSAFDAANRGLAYGDGVFETILCCAGYSALKTYHIARLRKGLDVLGIVEPDLAWLDEVFEVATAHSYAVIKLMAIRSGVAAGYRTDKNTADVVAILRALPAAPFVTSDLVVGVSDAPLVNDPRLAGVKHLNRLSQVLASQEAQKKSVDELLMCDASGHVIEAISSNVFFLIDGAWVTPPLPQAGVAGVMRQALLDKRLSLLSDAYEGLISSAILDQCSAAFLCNAVRGIMPISSINGKVLDSSLCAPIVQQVKQFFHA